MSEYDVYYNGVMCIIPSCSLGTYARYEETVRLLPPHGNYVPTTLPRSKKIYRSDAYIYRVYPVPYRDFRAYQLEIEKFSYLEIRIEITK